MAKLTPGQRRSEFIARARLAVRKGLSQAAFLRQAVAGGYSMRRQNMMTEWRNVSGVETKSELFQYVRKDRMPTSRVIAQVDWALSKEYMYKVKVFSRLRPGEPITSRFVNIMQDRPMTPGEIEAITWAMIQEQSPPVVKGVIKIVPVAVLQRIAI